MSSPLDLSCYEHAFEFLEDINLSSILIPDDELGDQGRVTRESSQSSLIRDFPNCSIIENDSLSKLMQGVLQPDEIHALETADIKPGLEEDMEVSGNNSKFETTTIQVGKELNDEIMEMDFNHTKTSIPIPVEITSQEHRRFTSTPITARKSDPTPMPPLDISSISISPRIPANQLALPNHSPIPGPSGMQRSGLNRSRSTHPQLEGTAIPLALSSQMTKAVLDFSDPESREEHPTKYGETGFTKHSFPNVAADALRGPDPLPEEIHGFQEMVSVRELAIPGQGGMKTVSAGLVPFILATKKKGEWRIPEYKIFEQITNVMEIQIFKRFPHLKHVMKKVLKWKGCGVFFLSSQDPEFLERWRDLIPVMNPTMNTYPREALMMGDEMSVMLRDGLATYEPECLPLGLFTRNQTLQGRIRVTCSKVYGPKDFTVYGLPKNGWRLCYLEGDSLFFKSLAKFPAHEQFPVGCGVVVIRGGVRRPVYAPPKMIFRGNFTWLRENAEQRAEMPIPAFLRSMIPVPEQQKKGSEMKMMVNNEAVPMVDVVNEKDVQPKKGGKGKLPIRGNAKPKNRTTRVKAQKSKKLAEQLRLNTD